MFMDELRDRVQLRPIESSRPFQYHRIQPEFGYHVLVSHMNMRRFTTIEGDKEKTVRTYAQNRWHWSSTGILLPR